MALISLARKPQRSAARYFEGWRGKHIRVDMRFDEMAGPSFDHGREIEGGVLAQSGSAIVPGWIVSPHGAALEFNSTQSDASTGDESTVDYGNIDWDSAANVITLEILMKFTEKLTPASGHRHRVLGSRFNFELLIHHDGTQWNVNNRFLQTSGEHREGPISKDVWHHIILRADGRGANGDRDTWVDGVQLATPESLGNEAIIDDSFTLGNRSGGLTHHAFKGEIAFIRMYDDLATDSQIAAMFRDPFPIFGLSSAHLEAGIGTIHSGTAAESLIITAVPVKETVEHAADAAVTLAMPALTEPAVMVFGGVGSESLVVTIGAIASRDRAGIGAESLVITIADSPGQPVDFQNTVRQRQANIQTGKGDQN